MHYQEGGANPLVNSCARLRCRCSHQPLCSGRGKGVEEGLAASIRRLRLPLPQVRAGMLEDVVDWYCSHPGYACWVNGVDVSTHMLNQEFMQLFLAVLIDPTNTVSAGKVDSGAFS
ncbi:COP9 signalosome complex subunit 5b-like [Hordeum vulgare]|nr:COP9 signalosome complex subunit 5b-like [Hordeum vulgare]